MKIVKTDWRSRLTDSSLSDLMMVQLNSPSIETFDPHDSINIWLKKSRRPCFNESNKTKPKDSPTLVSDAAGAGEEQDQSLECVAMSKPCESQQQKMTDSDDDDAQDSGAEEDFYSDESDDASINYRLNHAQKAYAMFQQISMSDD
ncbi:uncharacterized protein [Ptychodera flava]|uniref:uncharacterized protein n=1 Tax=Ptychodera flava TaxID=63121 RepID=UPI003969D0AE